MLKVYSCPLELRGIANKSSKKNDKVYYVLNCEADDGTAYSFYCPDFNALPQGLRKGDTIQVTFSVSYYKNQERLVVTQVVKIDDPEIG